MAYQSPSKQEMKEILQNAQTIAVVGLSDNPDRTSYQIASAMQKAGYKIIPVNPEIDESLGEPAYDSLTEVTENIDIINIFRRSEFLLDIARQAVETKANVFWAQQGIYHDEAYEFLKENDFTVVMDTCIKVAHSITIGK
ncbi:CoA-binding protein [Sediminibacillus albus]|uniref:Predicted CoA-binding protein n=1 Tax=Sediminibacillus albus TaxID=407036 RepID=A0A1G8VVG5_9BACI|nr:CoA-binding protein [Sediminibacillus albus]SDJ70078.1 Predicted CoA-binding protein [Sediminibacillus albus]